MPPVLDAPLRSSPGPKTGCSGRGVLVVALRAPLRSSPGPKTGCSVARLPPLRERAPVAILTRSEDRVQRSRRPTTPTPSTCCDPHPVRRPGAACAGDPPRAGGNSGCDPHPVRRPGAAQTVVVAPRRPCRVAILTRSEDRVQPGHRWCRPGHGGCRCDPHPVRRPGAATPLRRGGGRRSWCCDPHPVRRPGAAATLSQDLGRPRVSCDPHPVRRPGAACGPTWRPTSPDQPVAILTRSEDRVQLCDRGADG